MFHSFLVCRLSATARTRHEPSARRTQPSFLEKFGMANCKPTSTPGHGSEHSTQQPEDTLLNEEETQQYQASTGSVMHFSQITTYDIM